MALLNVIIIMAITMALSITITMKSISQDQEASPAFVHEDLPSHKKPVMNEDKILLPSKRLSRFMAERNPRASDHCHKDHDICHLVGGKNSTCCNNKCIDLAYDNKNCGACKNHCKYTRTCCRGQCVDLAYDKRHCGQCNHRCARGQYCVYGLCDYP